LKKLLTILEKINKYSKIIQENKLQVKIIQKIDKKIDKKR
jgi:hypothetical protein